jgi:hypothetical protein
MASDRPVDSRVPRREGESEKRRESPRPTLRTTAERACDDCAARTAFQAWHSAELVPSFNVEIDFGDWDLIPAGQRAVIELVTATISVPDGEWARLRLFTSLGSTAGNFDFTLTEQGVVGGKRQLVATHPLRVYSDKLIAFNVNRDNAATTGDASICISGYLAEA